MAKRRRSLSPPATTISSSSTNPVATAYFLPELIPSIASRLTSLQDFFALRAACRTYRALLPPSPSNLASQAPHLVLPHQAAGSFELFHLPLRRLLRLRLPHASSFTALESCVVKFYSFGCRVAIADRNYSGRCDLHFVYLLTGEISRLPEPPKYFNRVLLSGDLVLACNPCNGVIQYCRLGDAGWRVVSCHRAYQLKDLIFVKGILYALVTPGYLIAVVELTDNNSMELAFLRGKLDAQTVQEGEDFHLAECRGELLIIETMEFFPEA